MGPTTELRRELKRTFVPFMTARGFVLDNRHAPHFQNYRRTVGDRVQLLEIQWEKYGTPRFCVNLGQVGVEGTLCWGKVVAAQDAAPSHATENARLYPRGNGSSTRHWFRQDRPLLSALWHGSWRVPPEVPVRQLMDLFEEAEAYWRTGEVGPHLRVHTNSWAVSAT